LRLEGSIPLGGQSFLFLNFIFSYLKFRPLSLNIIVILGGGRFFFRSFADNGFGNGWIKRGGGRHFSMKRGGGRSFFGLGLKWGIFIDK
jgi:hypothetical protein